MLGAPKMRFFYYQYYFNTMNFKYYKKPLSHKHINYFENEENEKKKEEKNGTKTEVM